MIRELCYSLKSARPASSHIARLTATATFAYLIAVLVPAGTSRPVLAPLTALLVLQASLYQTIRSGIRKVASVAAGVLIAVGVSEVIGFSWWQLALVIAGALVTGRVLRLGDDLLEVPISAMLIFASAGSHTAATGRVVDTLVGTAAGLAGGLVFGAPRVQPAREAVGTLAGQLAELLTQMAADLTVTDDAATRTADGAAGDGAIADNGASGDHIDQSDDSDHSGRAAAVPDSAHVNGWLLRARALRDEIERVEDTLRQASDSVRLNPRSRLGRAGLRPVPDDLLVTEVALRGGLETLEHATVTVRGLARSILDSTGIDSECSPVRDAATRARLADVLGNLAEAIRTYGRVVQVFPSDSGPLKSELAGQLAAAHREQDALAALLEPRATDAVGHSEWPLRGEILTHVDRLRTGLRPEAVPHPEPRRPVPSPLARYTRRLPSQRDPAHDRAPRGHRERRDRERRDRVSRERGHWAKRPFTGRPGRRMATGGQPRAGG
jgi:Aromatic acid exporter family member 1